MIRLSKFANLVKPSATLAIAAKAKQMKAQGLPVYDFSLGEPDQNTPDHICAAAEKAIRAGQTHYTPAGGTTELREAVRRFYERFYHWSVGLENVMIAAGAKQAIHNALASIVGPGDEVIIPSPYWVSYSDLVTMTGATLVLVPTTPESGFKLTPTQFQKACTPRTKLIMFNSPCNPTGTVYTRSELEALADEILKTDVAVISDEIYEQLCYGSATPTCIATLKPKLAERTVTVSGASKSYAMTGWRMGWAVGPEHVIQAMAAIQSQETGCPSSISQAAAVAALDGPQDCVAQMRQEYAGRREIAIRRLREIPGLKFRDPDGAYYIFFDVSSYFNKTINGHKITDSESFCRACLDDALVNLVPGSSFGREGYVRMSFSSADADIDAGLKKFGAWLAQAK
jgi:aspartate aminotransferase